MTNQEILQEAIKKAVKNGWRPNGGGASDFQVITSTDGTNITERIGDISHPTKYMSVIFNHDFAKALWGEGLSDGGGDYYYDGPDTNWEWHLQQMVIAEDPIKYLGEHLDG